MLRSRDLNCKDEAIKPKHTDVESRAANLNQAVLKKLQRAVAAAPDIDLSELIPRTYSDRLSRLKQGKGQSATLIPEQSAPSPLMPSQEQIHDPYKLRATPAIVAYPLSSTAWALLGCRALPNSTSTEGFSLNKALAKVIDSGEIIFPTGKANGTRRKVIKCSHDLVIKIGFDDGTHTEHTTLDYIAQHKPSFPVPRAHGLILVGRWRFCFMSLVPGSTLRSVWPNLTDVEKLALSHQLDSLISELRQMPFVDGSSMGSVIGAVCKDARRHVKTTQEPITTIDQFDNFRFSNPIFGRPAYLEFFRRISASQQPKKIVFTHGDIRPENIIVQNHPERRWVISGIIDWEMSGFYPEDFECTKLTNTMTAIEDDDWYLFLPPCIAPEKYAARWALDRLWDKHVR